MTRVARGGAARVGLVTPFLHEVQEATIRVLAGEGIEVVAERHLNDPGNFSFARFTEDGVVWPEAGDQCDGYCLDTVEDLPLEDPRVTCGLD